MEDCSSKELSKGHFSLDYMFKFMFMGGLRFANAEKYFFQSGQNMSYIYVGEIWVYPLSPPALTRGGLRAPMCAAVTFKSPPRTHTVMSLSGLWLLKPR